MEGPLNEQGLVFANLHKIRDICNTSVYEAYIAFSGIDGKNSRLARKAVRHYEAIILQEITSGKHLKANKFGEFDDTYLNALRLVLDQTALKGIPLSKDKIAKALATTFEFNAKELYGYEKIEKFIIPICKALNLDLLRKTDVTFLKGRLFRLLKGESYNGLGAEDRLRLEETVKDLAPNIFTDAEFDQISQINIFNCNLGQVHNSDEVLVNARSFYPILERYNRAGIIGPKSINAARIVFSRLVTDSFLVYNSVLGKNILKFAIEKGILSEDDKNQIRNNIYDELVVSTVRNQRNIKRLSKTKQEDENSRVETMDRVKDYLINLASSVNAVKSYLGPTELPESLQLETSKLLGLFAAEQLKFRRIKKTTSN